MALIDNFENILQNLAGVAVNILSNLFGVDTIVYPHVNTVYTDIYNTEEGDSVDLSAGRPVTILFTGEIYSFLNASLAEIGMLGEVECYLKAPFFIRPGERIEYTRQDGIKVSFSVKEQKPIGFTTKIVSKWVILYIED